MLGDPKRLRTADGFGYLVSWKHRLRLQSDAQARAFVERILEDPANVAALRAGLGRPTATLEELAEALIPSLASGAFQVLKTGPKAPVLDSPPETDLFDLLPPEEPRRELESLTFEVVDSNGEGVPVQFSVFAPSGDESGALEAGTRHRVGDLEPDADVELELTRIVLPLRPTEPATTPDPPPVLPPDPGPSPEPQTGPTGGDPQTHAPRPPGPDTQTHTLTVRVVDELGEAIEGLPLSFVAGGEELAATTDDTGTGRVEASSADATVTLGAPATLLEAVGDRWAHVRDGDWLEEQPDHIFVDVAAPSVVVPLDAARTVTIVVQPRTVLARIKGMLFDTDRCFLLPSALEHLPRLTALYADHENSALLVVGHTDTTGDDAYNDTLSLERAQAVAAFLRDDPAVWVQRYDTNLDARKRWGAHEDNLMLQAVFERSGEAIEGSPMVHFQRSRGLEANGVASPQTREALITEYMALDGTTLPAGVEMGVYGCGERFPVGEDGTTVDTDAPDGHEDQLDRRVELIFFPAGLGVLPAPAGEVCEDGERVYEEWRRRAAETHEFDAVSHLHAIVLDDPIFGVAAGISVEATYASGLQQTATTDADGRLKLEPRGGDFVDLRYTFSGQEVTKRVFTAVDDVASPEGAWQRLVHLGYVPLPQPERQPPDPEALEDALLLFQLDYSLEPTATQDDETVATLLRAHDQDLRPWKDRDWEIPDEPEPDVEKPKEEVS